MTYRLKRTTQFIGAYALLWLLSGLIMLDDDAAMLAFMFS